MKIVFMVLGFLFLGSAFVWNFVMEDEPRLAGSVEWRCDPPTESVRTMECATTGSDDTFLRLDIAELPTTILLGLTGIGCMVAAAAVGTRASSPVRQPPQQVAPPMSYPPR
jgi:hypothetical protein